MKQPVPIWPNGKAGGDVIYSFLYFELDTELFELRRGGEVRSLEPQVFDLLACLLERSDRLVIKDEIFEVGWRGRIVSEAALTRRLKAARQVLEGPMGIMRAWSSAPRPRFPGGREVPRRR